MKKTCLFFFFLFICFVNLKAQLGKEAWHWQFGNHCSLDFSSGIPVPGWGSLNTNEGSASISDINSGQLLFYTDGIKVWNRNDTPMPNGDSLFGNTTTTQSALIVPKPGSSNLYYVLTCDYQGNPHGVCYSIVNMNSNSGLGDVILKNQSLSPAPMTEKLTAVRHCNGVDYWIIDHALGSDAFYVYLLSSSGINSAPVVSHAGVVELAAGYSGIGYLKASPNGKKLALASFQMGVIQIFDFNNVTGVISNPTTLGNHSFQCYGVSFSSDNSKLYTSEDGFSILCQYDLSSNNPINIVASRTVIDSTPSFCHISLQLALDGKIYVASCYPGLAISVINSPNLSGVLCNFQLNSLTLANSTNSHLGLPNFIDGGISRRDTHNISVCNNILPVSISADTGTTDYLWSTGDTAQMISTSAFGNYWVSYINSDGCKATDTFHLLQTQVPKINFLNDTSICSNLFSTPVTIDATAQNASFYSWNDGFAGAEHTITSAGIYWVDLTIGDYCISRDSFAYNIDTIPHIDLGQDTALCKALSLSANSGLLYNWSTGATTQQINVTNSGIYSVIITSPQGCKNSDTINLTIYTPPIINVLGDSTECGNSFSPVKANANYPNTVLYNWSDGFSGQSHTLPAPGIYWVDFTLNNTCISRDSFNLFLYPYPIVSLGSDATFCLGRLPLNAYNSSCTYMWRTGETTPDIIVIKAGTYWVEVNRHGCVSSDTLVVNPEYSAFNFVLPNIVTPNDDNINDFIDFSNYQFSTLQLDIYNRWGLKIFENSDPSTVWKPACEDGSYYYVAQYKIECGSETQSKTLKGFITVIR